MVRPCCGVEGVINQKDIRSIRQYLFFFCCFLFSQLMFYWPMTFVNLITFLLTMILRWEETSIELTWSVQISGSEMLIDFLTVNKSQPDENKKYLTLFSIVLIDSSSSRRRVSQISVHKKWPNLKINFILGLCPLVFQLA